MLSKLSPLFSSSLRAQRSNPVASHSEWNLKNLQQTLLPRPRHSLFSDLFRESCVNILLFNNMTNLLTKLVTCCHKILCTGHRMTGAISAGLVPPVSLLLPIRGRGNNLLILAKNSAKASVATEKVPLIRCIGFAERERETFCLLIFHLSFLIFC